MLAPSKPLTPRQLATLQFPLWVSDKKDGIRVLTFPSEGGLSRTFKPIPNKFLRMVFKSLVPDYLDGELLCGPAYTFGDTMSAFSSHEGTPFWKFHVFDCFKNPNWKWEDRYEQARDLVGNCNELLDVSILPHVKVDTLAQVEELEQDAVERGEEGIMIRRGNFPYKQGRSTIAEQGLLKIKRFETSEAQIVGFNELMENRNPIVISETGKSKRSSRTEGKMATGMLGSFVCTSKDYMDTFAVGGGMTDLQRRNFWNNRNSLISKIIHFKHTPHGQIDRPKSTVFKGFRDPIDIV